jgi:hypothetical protein
MLETALSRINGWQGWVPIGNTPQEVLKMSGGVSEVVWHIHGATNLPQDRSRLVLTQKDYDDFYLEDGPFTLQLRALLSQNRIIFIGFGFADPEVERFLRRIGRLTNPARPIYAFLNGLSGRENEDLRNELLEKYNVDVITYEVIGGSHRQLQDILDVYGSMILQRSVKLGRPALACPSYDPVTTGLLIYNELCLRGGAKVHGDALGTLLRSRILSLLKHRGQLSRRQFVEDLKSQINLLRQQAQDSDASDEIGRVLDQLAVEGLITLDDPGSLSERATLSQEGANLVASQAATSERLYDQFVASLRARANDTLHLDSNATDRVATAAESFLKDCIDRRALGVAMAELYRNSDNQTYHMVALLQELPRFMEQLATPEEAIGLTKLVQGVLARPTEVESHYIGLALQAKFGVHLLGYDPATLEERARDMSQTAFLMDSTTLITFLARSSLGFDTSRLLINRLRELGSVVLTTSMLTDEVAEHARWVFKMVDNRASRVKIEALRAATGKSGDGINAFLDGFLEEIYQANIDFSYGHYLSQVLQPAKIITTCTPDHIQQALQHQQILSLGFSEWPGYRTELLAQRDNLQERIGQRRQDRNTYKHERQVKTEAEALIIIQSLREGSFQFDHRTFSNAFFISNSRVIDSAATSGLPVTMRPDAALQWAATFKPCSIDELSFLTSCLLSELAEKDLTIVDKVKLRAAFAPLISPSKEKLAEEMQKHHNLISGKYGVSEIEPPFDQVDDLDLPIALNSYYAQRAEALEKDLLEERKLRLDAVGRSGMTQKEKAELARLQMQEQVRRTKAKSKKRSAQSAPKKKKKKKKGNR